VEGGEQQGIAGIALKGAEFSTEHQQLDCAKLFTATEASPDGNAMVRINDHWLMVE
jgi:hypothetical protein